MKPCPHCGWSIEDQTLLCPNCGKEITQPVAPEPVHADSLESPGKPKSHRALIYVLVGAVLVLGLSALCGLGLYQLLNREFGGPRAQAILEPDDSLATPFSRHDLESDAQILAARSSEMGAPMTFRVNGDNEIVGEGRAVKATREFVQRLIAPGLLELVVFGKNPVPDGTVIVTDSEYQYFAPAQGIKRHTLLTNADFASASVIPGQDGAYEVAFTLTESGRPILEDFSMRYIGNYLCIVMDRVVMSCPVIKNPIMDGQGVIQGEFTKEEAEAIAAYLRVKGPLPIPLTIKAYTGSSK